MKTCPSCREERPWLLETCACGHEFRDVVRRHGELASRLHSAWARIVFGGFLVVMCAAIAFTVSDTWAIGGVLGVMIGLRGMMARGQAQSALREIEDAGGRLPEARVLKALPARSVGDE
jgi:hypothetical protein